MSRTLHRSLSVLVLAVSCLLSGNAQTAAARQTAIAAGESITLLPDGQVLLLGGQGPAVPASAESSLVDSQGLPRRLTASLNFPRFGHTATVLPDGSVAVIGGTGADGKTVPAIEVFDPAAGSFRTLKESLLIPRTHHTATLLPGGLLLIAGGVTGNNEFQNDVQTWDYRTGKVLSYASVLYVPRENHQAKLLANGKVLFSGGTDVYGHPVTTNELYDPEIHTATELPRNAITDLAGLAPRVSASFPLDRSADLEVDRPLWMLFSKEVDVRTLGPAQVRLTTAAGSSVDAKVTGAEGGKLAFVLPTATLQPATDYVLTIDGVKDYQGIAVPRTVVRFQTGGIPIDTGDSEWIPSAANLSGNWNSGTGRSKWQDMQPLQAAERVTALSGQALRLNGYPLANVTLTYEGKQTSTDSTGRFLIGPLSPGRHVLTIDGRTANHAGVEYGLYEVGVTVKPNITNVLNYTIWMSKLDTANAVKVSFPTAKEIVVTTPRIPGLELHLPANTTVVDHDGRTATSISITAIPVDKAPFPLPSGVKIPVYFTIQPGGASIEVGKNADGKKGAWLVYPNSYKLPAKSSFDFWNYDADSRGWYVYGQGKVDSAATRIVPDAGVYIYEFTGAMVGSPVIAPGTGPSAGGGASGGDPVDLSTGLFVYNRTDLVIPDSVPLTVSRTYRPNDSMSRSFGVGQTDNYDIFMVGDTFPYTYQELILPDGSRIRFNRTSAGTSYTDAVYMHTATRTKWYGATFYYSPSTFPNGYWVLRLKDGTEYSFPDSYGQANQGVQAATYIRDRNGNTLAITRGSNGNLSKVTSPNGNALTYTYDASNRISTITDNTNRSLSYTYSAQGDLASFTDPAGGITSYTYDDQHNMLTVKDPVGNTFVTNVYDSNGRVTKQTMSDGGVYQFAWNLTSNSSQTWVQNSTSPNAGQVNRYSSTDYQGYTALIASVEVTDPRGYIRKVAFNPYGYVSSDTRALGQPQQEVFSTSYYADNLVKSTTDPLSRQRTFDYDAFGNVTNLTLLAGTSNPVTYVFSYASAFNQLATATDPLGHTVTYTYDSAGNLVTTIDPLGHKTTATYDGSGDLVKLTDPVNQTAQFSYLGDYLVGKTDPLGNTTTEFRDYAGRIVSTADALGNVTQFGYDALNRVTQLADPLSKITKYTYDGNGDPLKVTDPLNHTITLGYDSLSRMVSLTDGLGRKAKSVYDRSGGLVSSTDRKGQVTTYTRDPLNRIVQTGFGTATSGSTTTYQSTIQYTFDVIGRITKVVDPTGGTITRTYDSLDRITNEATPQGSVSYTYDNAGRTTSLQVAGQSAVSYSYDAANRLTSITQGSKTVSFTLDSGGRRTAMTLPNGISVSYTYDGGSRLTQIVYKLGSKTIGNLTYTYDKLNRRTSAGGTLAQLMLPNALSVATYDAANELTKWGSTTITHDLNGSILSDGSNNYSWNARGQLASVSGGLSESLVYDAFSRRTTKTNNGIAKGFLYSGVDVAQELQGSSVTANLITGGVDEVFDRAETGSDLVPLVDGQGSIVALADSSGALATQYAYDPFGNTDPLGATSDNAQQYTGREDDGGSLYFYRARYYNAQLQQFLSEDPSAFFGGSLNFYTYTLNSPNNLTDPSGKNPLLIACAVGAAFDVGSSLIGDWMSGSKVTAGDLLGSAARGCVFGLAGGVIGEALAPAFDAAAAWAGDLFADAFSASRTAAADYSAIGSTGQVGEDFLANAFGGESQAYFDTSMGARYVDQLADGIAYESKVGYTSLTNSISTQIAKDAELVNSGAVNSAEWHFFTSPVTGLGGPSGPLANALNNAGIPFVIH